MGGFTPICGKCGTARGIPTVVCVDPVSDEGTILSAYNLKLVFGCVVLDKVLQS